MNKATRKDVYLALDTEREYQAARWNRSTTSTGGEHESLADWLMYMRAYIAKAEQHLSFEAEPEATMNALHHLRKVTALGVAAMECLGALARPRSEFPDHQGHTLLLGG